MPLVNTYTTLTDVRRLLRNTPPRGRIKFSDSYSALKKWNDNTGTIELMNIGISQYYSDNADYKIVFGNDSTTFTFYKFDTEKSVEYPIGVGVKQQDFTSQDGFFQINSSSWIGYTFPGDTIMFKTDSHMSLIDATAFIQDAEYFVDTILEKNIRFTSTSEQSLRFDTTSGIPKAIQLACTKIASYFIYKAIWLETNSDDKGTIGTGWLKEGLDLLASYVAKFNLALSTSAPMIGHPGTNKPMSMSDDYVFQTSEFNLRIPLNSLFVYHNDINLDKEARNFLKSSSYTDSITSDIADMCFGIY
jgi:hypothetical protein